MAISQDKSQSSADDNINSIHLQSINLDEATESEVDTLVGSPTGLGPLMVDLKRMDFTDFESISNLFSN